ncbi:MAG TPA: thermonuclease family protein [Stellaceae bacterium]|nr:thermonuclease family protein [Stellaceae bacterium]
MRRGRFALAAFAFSLTLPALAETPASALPETGRARVQTVQDGATLTLDDGRTVRLAGILAPLPPLGRPPDDWPLVRQAREALATAAEGKAAVLRGPTDLDRYGRVITQVEIADGDWLEGVMLTAGLARVETTPQHRELAREMLALEAAARDARLGLWASPYYAVRMPEDLAKSSGSFELVEGRLAASDLRRTTLWLDFPGSASAVRLDKPARALFGTQDPTKLVGKRVRVRGWVTWLGRPVIDVTHPEQIESLDPPAG